MTEIVGMVREAPTIGVRFGCIALLLATVTLSARAFAEDTTTSRLPAIDGGYVLFTMGKHQLRLERGWTSASRLPAYHSWKVGQPVVSEWDVLDDQLSYFAQNLEISNTKPECRQARVAIWKTSPGGPFPGQFYRDQYPKSEPSEVQSLREFFGPLRNGAALRGGRYFILTDPNLKMSNDAYPMAVCDDGRFGTCGVTFEVSPNLLARFRHDHKSCGLDRLIETTVAIKKQLANRYRLKSGD